MMMWLSKVQKAACLVFLVAVSFVTGFVHPTVVCAPPTTARSRRPSFAVGTSLSDTETNGIGIPDSFSSATSGAVQQQDSIELYAQDIAHVLNDLRSTEDDPCIPYMFHRRSRSPTFTHPWTTVDWEFHYTRFRYWNYVKGFPSSRIMKRVAPQLALLVLWGVFVAWLPLGSTRIKLIEKAALPLTPLSLVSTFVAALLTLRTNQCLSRLAEARVAMGNAVAYTRQMAQLVASSVYPSNARLGLLASRHVALYTWLLRSQLRGLDCEDGMDEDLVCTMLPQRTGASSKKTSPSAAFVLAHRKMPMAVLAVLRQIFSSVKGSLTLSEADALDRTVQELNHCTLTLERILASPIPPLYSAHTGRLLMFNLVFLPLALRGILNRVATIITTTAVGFAMLGLDEISHLLENPFRLMPLWYLSKNAMKDCGDALVCQPPPLESDDEWIPPSTPPYW